MIAQYTPTDEEVTLYGLDFFDADDNLIEDRSFGTDKAAYAEALAELDDDDSPTWPETAVRFQPYTQTAIQTTWEVAGYVDPYRRNSAGRFQTRGHS